MRLHLNVQVNEFMLSMDYTGQWLQPDSLSLPCSDWHHQWLAVARMENVNSSEFLQVTLNVAAITLAEQPQPTWSSHDSNHPTMYFLNLHSTT